MMIGIAACLYLCIGCALSGSSLGLLNENPGTVDADFNRFEFAMFVVLCWLPAHLIVAWRNRH